MKHTLLVFVLLGALLFPLTPQAPASSTMPLEVGTFRLHKFMQPIGSERYEIARSGEELVLTSTFEFSDRGTRVPLATTLRARPDLTPIQFEIKGYVARGAAIDTSVAVGAGAAVIRESGKERREPVPDRFFTVGGYAPVAMQMALLRYWRAHGSPETLRTLPLGDLRIQDRGEDVFSLGDTRLRLRRYSIDGLLWGREWVWLDAAGGLAAVVTTDAEFDHFEAVREGLEPLLPEFVSRAVADGMAQLAAISEGVEAPTGKALAVVGATLVDGTGRAPIADSAVVIRDGRIVAVGTRRSVSIPKDAVIVDASGKWAIPGLWDMHAHVQQVEWGPVYLAAGVTTVRDCANELEFIVAARDAIESGRGVGPRLILAGLVDGDSPGAIGVVRANTSEEARAVVTKYKAAGFDQIKIYQSVKPEIVRVLAAEAHKVGMTVTGHVPSGMNAVEAVEAGMDQINHLHWIAAMILPLFQTEGKSPAEALELLRASSVATPEAKRLIEFFAKRGTVVDPTMALRDWIWHPASVPFATLEPGAAKVPAALAGPINSRGVPDSRAEYVSLLLARYLEIVGALHKAGVPIVAGTDQTVPGHSLHREIELYVRAGMTPMEAIQSATLVPARVMGREKQLGTIEAGKLADLVVLDADPLADIRNTRRIRYVLTRGRVYEPAPLWRAAGFQP